MSGTIATPEGITNPPIDDLLKIADSKYALVIFAAWHPLRVLAGSYLFGAALALGPALQARGYGVNQFLLDVVPYVLTLAVLALLGRRTLQAAPDGLKRVFDSARPA